MNITHGYASNIVSFGREREMFRNAYLSNFIRILSIYDVRMDASKRANFFLFFFLFNQVSIIRANEWFFRFVRSCENSLRLIYTKQGCFDSRCFKEM